MDIRPLANTGPIGLDALGASAAPAPSQETPASAVLDPPVKLDINASAYGTRFVRDGDTGTIVFQVVDPTSDSVVKQLPSETALRNRAYDAAHREAAPSSLSRVA